jgi:thiamine transport system ATP-binding protein
MLEIRSVTVTYPGAAGPVTAVSDVSLKVLDGGVLALLGPSGCGKSTLLRAIAGLEPVTAGQICWDGGDLRSVPVHRRGFWLMFQDGVLFPHRDVAGNIAYGLRRAGLDRGEIDSRVGELLELVGLPGFGRRRVATLSGGEAQRVALARALAPGPRLLFLDEPLAALDRSLRERLLTDLRTVLSATGTTAVFVTHDQAEAFAIADRIAVLQAGTVRQIGPAREVWARPADAWVAGFVGYSTVLDAVAARTLGLPVAAGQQVGLRPAALILDDAGPVRGRILNSVRAPDGLRVTVQIENVGTVQATGPVDTAGAIGDAVRMRLEPGETAIVGGSTHATDTPAAVAAFG